MLPLRSLVKINRNLKLLSLFLCVCMCVGGGHVRVGTERGWSHSRRSFPDLSTSSFRVLGGCLFSLNWPEFGKGFVRSVSPVYLWSLKFSFTKTTMVNIVGKCYSFFVYNGRSSKFYILSSLWTERHRYVLCVGSIRSDGKYCVFVYESTFHRKLQKTFWVKKVFTVTLWYQLWKENFNI